MMIKKIQGATSALSGLFFLIATSCTWDQVTPEVDCSLAPIEITLLESNDTGCGVSGGSFTVSASGGEAPYVYTADGTTNDTGMFEDLPAGNYTVIATDAKGCAEEVIVAIQNLDGVNLDQVFSDQAGCGAATGSIEVVASGGVEPYTYSLNGGIPQANSLFSGLGHGSYTVSITDQLGCEVTESVEILTGVTFENSIKAIVQNNCASCHPSFTNFNTLKARASAVKSRTGSRDMPRGSSLSQEQIDRIACWVDDGALEN